ncbi:MAG: carboxypeptidase regulatory-like domain-containing protein [Ignavibacteriales bacterium]|nr:MAG: carboxypeptidase regulatory-like domain-containing protein [Ignavibacteriales bacterium]
MHQTKLFEKKINFAIAVLILSIISIHCSSPSSVTRIYEGPYRGTNSNNYAVVVGRVIDQEDKSPLVGGVVTVGGYSFSGSVDEKGNYVILNIPPGVYDIVAKNIGYEDTRINGVKLDSNKMYIIDFQLIQGHYFLD